MAVQKSKKSKSRRNTRRAQYNRNRAVRSEMNLSVCPQCQSPKLPHRVCSQCGSYKGKEIISMDQF